MNKFEYTIQIIVGNDVHSTTIFAHAYVVTERRLRFYNNENISANRTRSVTVASYPSNITLLVAVQELIPEEEHNAIPKIEEVVEAIEEEHKKVEHKYCIVGEGGSTHNTVLYVGTKGRCIVLCKRGIVHPRYGTVDAHTVDYDRSTKEYHHDIQEI